MASVKALSVHPNHNLKSLSLQPGGLRTLFYKGETIAFSHISRNKSTKKTTKYSQIPDKITTAGNAEKL